MLGYKPSDGLWFIILQKAFWCVSGWENTILSCLCLTSALLYLLIWTRFNSVHRLLSYHCLSTALLSFPPPWLLLPIPIIPSLLYLPPSHLSCVLSFRLLSAYSKALPCMIHSDFLLIFFNLRNPFAYSCCNFPPRLHLNNTKPVYVCQLWNSPILTNIIEHIPVVRRWCQQGCKNK